MAENLGQQLMQFGDQLRGAIEAPARAELEISKLRQKKKSDSPRPNEILENLAVDVYNAEDPESRKMAMDKFNQAAETLGPMIERMQRIKADWKKTYGKDLPMDEPKIAKAPLPPDFIDDPPEKSTMGSLQAAGKGAIEMFKSGSLDALRDAKDPKRQAALEKRYSEKEAQLRAFFESVDPAAGPVEANDYVNEAMKKLKERDKLFDEGLVDEFKAPSKIDYVQTFGYERIDGRVRKVRKSRGESEPSKKYKKKSPPKGKIKVTNGKETLLIDRADLKDAQKSGYRVAK